MSTGIEPHAAQSPAIGDDCSCCLVVAMQEDAVRRGPTAAKPKTIDAYLSGMPGDQRAALQQLRETIHAAAPSAEECISYGIPAFRQHGMLVGFGATRNHCAFYLMSSTIAEAFRDDLEKYDTSKGTIRFQPDKPLPAGLVRRLVKARIGENEG
jgi:uncharacterized protein YdhG (YjbR/CyaY superfamily)